MYRSKLFIILCVVSQLSMPTLAGVNDAKAATEASVGFVKDVSEVVSQIKVHDITSSVKQITRLAGTIATCLGPIGSGLSLFFSLFAAFGPERGDLSEIKSRLNQISAQISRLDDKLDNVKIELLQEHQYVRLMGKRDDVRSVWHAFNEFSQNPMNITKQKFISSCTLHEPKRAIDWLSIELDSSQRSIGRLMRNQRNKEILVADTQFMIAMVSQAAWMETACDSARFAESPELNQSRVLTANAASGTLQKIETTLEREGMRIDFHFMVWVKRALYSRKQDKDISKSELANVMFRKAREMVPWRDWLVAIYDRDSYGTSYWSYTGSQTSFEFWNDRLDCILTSAPKVAPRNWTDRASGCMSNGLKDFPNTDRKDANNAVGFLKDCAGEYRWRAVAALSHSLGVEIRADKGPGIVYRSAHVCKDGTKIRFKDSGCYKYWLILNSD